MNFLAAWALGGALLQLSLELVGADGRAVQSEQRFMFGTHQQKLEQLADLFALKAAVEAKEDACKLRETCTR